MQSSRSNIRFIPQLKHQSKPDKNRQVDHKPYRCWACCVKSAGFLKVLMCSPRASATHGQIICQTSLSEALAKPRCQIRNTHSMNASHSSSGSTAVVDNTVGEDPAVVTKTTSSSSADSCTWYANASCKRPRTCYDCLNVKVASGECAIMPNGMCISLSEYSNFLNKQQEFGIYYKYYPSSKYTYCSADDSACSACTSNWVSDYSSTGTIETPAYCTGLDGCICLARCELPDWSTSILTDQCSSSSRTNTNSQTSTEPRIGFALAVGIAFGVLLGLWGIKLLFRRRGIGRGRGSSIPAIRETWTLPRRPRTGPQLALTGWKELREKLIAFEKKRSEETKWQQSSPKLATKTQSMQMLRMRRWRKEATTIQHLQLNGGLMMRFDCTKQNAIQYDPLRTSTSARYTQH